MQGMFYAIPTLYPIDIVIDKFSDKAWIAKLVMINPVSQIIQGMRYSLVTDHSVRTSDIVQAPYSLIPFAIVLLSLIAGSLYFRKESKYFAEKL